MIASIPAFEPKIPLTSIIIKQEKPKEIKPVLYTIVEGDKLENIAKSQNTTVDRLFDKNPSISNPDAIDAGETIEIPRPDEILANRPLPPAPSATASLGNAAVISPGNSYEPGQCVWFVKNMRPDIPNNWGNATDWFANAQAQGWPTGDTPRVGAVGWTYGHVVLITGVHGNLVDYTDMNGRWVPFEIGTGTVSASKYRYIY